MKSVALQRFKQNGPLILWSMIGIVLLIEILRDAGRGGDFIGYVYSGDLVLNKQNIYSDPLNTWPPFFSIFSVPIALLDQVNGYLLRLIWLAITIIAFFDLGNRLFKMIPALKGINYRNSYHIAIIIVPFLISFRYLLDNLANIQINIFMLWLAVIAHEALLKKHMVKAAFLLALSISLKAYTIFILFFYLYKRLGSMVLWTLSFLVLLNCIPFIVFGYEMTIHYYDIWWNEIASVPPTVHHKNQSVFGAMQRFLTGKFPGHHFYVNLVEWTPELAKKISYIIITLAAIFPAFLFRKKTTDYTLTYEWIFVLTAVPILSPLSWKAYFIFLYPAYLILYHYIFPRNQNSSGISLRLKVFYWISVGLTVLSTEAIAGDEWSDRLESLSVITIGTVILLVLLMMLYNRINRLTPNVINHN
ncbi:MAG: DUF2029 domain-containing protein [Saprospiraceae bacterium]|nr:DUF2029 domain-containing protein [Saprospiraceae bacterium]